MAASNGAQAKVAQDLQRTRQKDETNAPGARHYEKR